MLQLRSKKGLFTVDIQNYLKANVGGFDPEFLQIAKNACHSI